MSFADLLTKTLQGNTATATAPAQASSPAPVKNAVPTGGVRVQVPSGNEAYKTPSGSVWEYLPNGTRQVTLAPQFGGGAYNVNPANPSEVVNTGHTTYGGEQPQAGMQRDDIISVGLGGANSNPANIRREKTLPKSQQTKFVQTPTDALEGQLAGDVKSGKTTLGQARLKEMTTKQNQTKPISETNFLQALFSPDTYSPSNIKSTIQNTPGLNGQQTSFAKNLDKTLNATVGERLGAIGRSIKTGSVEPLKQSFATQAKQFAIGKQPGESPEEYLNRQTSVALMLSGEMKDVGGITPVEPGKIKVNNYQDSIKNEGSSGQPNTPKIESSQNNAIPVEQKLTGKTPSETQLSQTNEGGNTFKPNINENNRYVKNEPINIDIGKNDKVTAKGLREEFSGVKNSQIVRGNQLADEIRTAVPDKLERQGMFWNKAANGDANILRQMAADPKLETYKPQIEKALNLSPEAKASLDKVTQYYNEAGSVSKELGTIKGITENYQNRIYTPEPPKDFVSNELKQNLKQTTSHAKARVFDTEFQAAQAGKKFATTDVADALSIHNEEMARVNTSRNLAQTMADNGLGQWTENGKMPADYSKVGGIKKGTESFVAPKGIAKGLEAIADPDFTKKIDSLRGIGKYQGIVKTVDLSYSFFHHLTMAAQTLAQGGWTAIKGLPIMDKMLSSPEFGQIEQDFTRNTGITSKVADNQDILRNLLGGEEGLRSKPGIKQFLQGAEKGSNFLFGKLQRYLKVMDYGQKVSNWAGSHPTATDAEVTAFKRSLAKEVNSAYGGLNWEAMGMTKSNVSLLRTVLLAPDWTVSNIEQAKMAFGSEGAPAAKAAWGNYARAIVGGMAITEGLNKLLTGHFTNQNPTGHKMEVQVAPNVYVSLIRGGPGDLVKLVSNIQESGLAGVSRFAQGKLSPFIRTVIEGLSGVDYSGRSIYTGNTALDKTKSGLSNLAASALPIPIGAATTYKYLSDQKKQGTSISLLGTAAIATGLGRYSKNSAFNSAIQNTKQATQNAKSKMGSTYAQVQSLLKQGKNDEAQKIVNGLSDSDYKAYQLLKSADKAKTTLGQEPKMFNTVQQVHDLLQQGETQKAQAIVDGLSDNDYRIYKLVKAKAGY